MSILNTENPAIFGSSNVLNGTSVDSYNSVDRSESIFKIVLIVTGILYKLPFICNKIFPEQEDGFPFSSARTYIRLKLNQWARRVRQSDRDIFKSLISHAHLIFLIMAMRRIWEKDPVAYNFKMSANCIMGEILICDLSISGLRNLSLIISREVRATYRTPRGIAISDLFALIAPR